jgi:hypothetical protein
MFWAVNTDRQVKHRKREREEQISRNDAVSEGTWREILSVSLGCRSWESAATDNESPSLSHAPESRSQGPRPFRPPASFLFLLCFLSHCPQVETLTGRPVGLQMTIIMCVLSALLC